MNLLYSFSILFSLLVLVAIGCDKGFQLGGTNTPVSTQTGTGGSLARFTIAANHLYLVDHHSLEVYDLANPTNPVKKTSVSIGRGVETIYPYGDKLFIGSRDGMYIYSIANPSQPVKLGEARHVRSCDPVVANDSIAYVTLQGSGNCGAATDGLYIYDIRNITAPVQKSLLPMSTPYGLGTRDSVVFVCRKANGLTLVNAKNPSRPQIMYTLTGAEYRDVIPIDTILICYVGTGLLLYNTSNLNQLVRIGEFKY